MGTAADIVEARLDRAFMALADSVRRAIVARLSRGPATVNELAAPFDITKQAVSKHIQVLEHAGLVTRSRDAQLRSLLGNANRVSDVLGRRSQQISGLVTNSNALLAALSGPPSSDAGLG